jgi:hypothetical protein
MAGELAGDRTRLHALAVLAVGLAWPGCGGGGGDADAGEDGVAEQAPEADDGREVDIPEEEDAAPEGDVDAAEEGASFEGDVDAADEDAGEEEAADAEADAEATGEDGGEDDAPPDCAHCSSLRVPGCCEGAWECPGGECTFRCAGGATPPLIWDLDAIEDESTLDAAVDEDEGYPRNVDGVTLHSVWFDSWEWVTLPDGSAEQTTIRIHSLVGVPPGLGPDERVPGMLIGHGLHGQVEEGGSSTFDTVVNDAKNYRLVTIGISGPGNGLSEGHGTQASHGGSECILFNTEPDVRGSWLYSYALAGMRALTYLATRPEVDAARLAATGASGGGLLSLLVGGIDRRVVAAVPGAACGALDLAVDAGAWEATMLDACSVPRDSTQVRRFYEAIDPINYTETVCSPTFLLNGFQDEFFPVTATRATYDGLLASGQAVRWLVMPNFDHGYFFSMTGYCASDCPLLGSPGSLSESLRRSEAGRGYWFRHHVFADPDFAFEPAVPTLAAVDGGDGTATFTLTVDDGGAGWRVADARVWLSADRACTLFPPPEHQGYPLALVSGSTTDYAATHALPGPFADLVFWGEVTYEMPRAVFAGGPNRVSFSSVPELPAGFVPVVRPLADPEATEDPCEPGTCIPRAGP